MTLSDASPYLEGNYAPVADEVTEFNLPVSGTIPPELVGRFVRNGPNPITTPDMESHHWFLGDGMVHGLRIADGKAAWFRNRYVGSEAVVSLLGADRTGSPPAAFGANTNVIGHGGQTLAIVEAGQKPVALTYELDTVGVTDFSGTLPTGFSAHPKVDPLTGELHAMCYHWPDQVDKVHYVVVGPDGRVTKAVEIPTPTMPMIHDMGLTQTYAAVFDLPVAVSIEMAMAGARFPLAWQPGYNARIGLLRRDADTSDDITWCEIDPCFAYHPLNSYDTEDGKVVIDVCEYDRMFDNDTNGPLRDSSPRLARWTVDPNAGSVRRETLDDYVQEFPRVNDAYANQPYRYGYLAGGSLDGAGNWFGSTVKHDLERGTSEVRAHGAGREPGEPVFVPREGSAAEDDGWILAFVYDTDRDSSDLVILAADDITGDEVARVTLPQRVPNGFHGNWIPDRDVAPSG